ncbi:MAG TPA: hypothetical protein VGH19_11235 [Verrucomicrobiae bacterium]
MKWQRLLPVTLATLAVALIITGCARRTRTVVVQQPAPTVYVAPSPTATPVVYQVQQAPPQPVAETRPPAPSSGHVWISGYWAYSSTGYTWTPGRWMKPPRPKSEWVPGHWQRTGNGNTWEFREGYWR